MCIIVYEQCINCSSCSKSVYRCISKSYMLSIAPCQPQCTLDKPNIYPHEYRCYVCYANKYSTAEYKEYMINMSRLPLIFTTKAMELVDNFGYVCMV